MYNYSVDVFHASWKFDSQNLAPTTNSGLIIQPHLKKMYQAFFFPFSLSKEKNTRLLFPVFPIQQREKVFLSEFQRYSRSQLV